MNKFSDRSNKNLSTSHPKLVALFRKVLKVHDCAITCGHRGKDDQDEAYFKGRSKLRFPHSKHNSLPSMAIDAVPYDNVNKKAMWDSLKNLYLFAGIVKGVASEMGLVIKWGGDWDSDNDFGDQTFDDLVHFELEE